MQLLKKFGRCLTLLRSFFFISIIDKINLVFSTLQFFGLAFKCNWYLLENNFKHRSAKAQRSKSSSKSTTEFLCVFVSLCFNGLYFYCLSRLCTGQFLKVHWASNFTGSMVIVILTWVSMFISFVDKA